MQILISLKFQGSYEKMENVLESLKIVSWKEGAQRAGSTLILTEVQLYFKEDLTELQNKAEKTFACSCKWQ